MKNISIVISLYNEEEGIKSFKDSLVRVLSNVKNLRFEVIWVNDGSNDNSHLILEKECNSDVTANVDHVIIEFSKNFGHEAAMIAGIDNATGEAIICMDADGQHPPGEIPNMIKSYLAGNEIILMERLLGSSDSLLKKTASFLFYKLINLISDIKLKPMSSDFFLISNRISEILGVYYREKNRFIRGFIQSVGFSICSLQFSAPERSYGKSNYSLRNLFKLALDATFTFSFKPLRVSILLSVLFVVITLMLSAYTLYQFSLGAPPSGYTTLLLFSSFSFSLLFIVISILSMYFEKLIDEIRQSPLYIIKKMDKV